MVNQLPPACPPWQACPPWRVFQSSNALTTVELLRVEWRLFLNSKRSFQ